ncbi:MAG: hypothetical protein ACRENE_19585 [Polyangiaceae bacterium]
MSQRRQVLSAGVRLLPLAIASVAIGWPLSAAAQDSGASARAAALSREGRTLRDGGRVTDACRRFAEAKELAPGFETSIDLADCYERAGKTTSAWSEFSSAERLARERGDARADAARSRMKALEAHLSRVTIEVGAATQAEDPEILLDGQAVPRAAYGSPLGVDPGEHVLTVASKVGPRRTLAVNVESNVPLLSVRAEDAKAAAAPKSDPPANAVSPADALFVEGKKLRDAGKFDAACASFAQSEQLAPGVGIALYLADCYQRAGRIASAWIEFAAAADAAHSHADAREATARARAAALEPSVKRVTIEVPASTPQDTALVQLDGRTVPPAMWNIAIATDPGDHLVAFQAPGKERRTYPVLVADEPSVVVHVGEPESSAGSPVVESPAPAAPPASGSVPGPAVSSTRQWVELGLLGGAVVSGGVGAGLLVVKNGSMSNGGTADGRPYVDPVATAASKVAFVAAGSMALASIILYLTNPRSKDAAVYVRPNTVLGGAGATLGGVF